MKVSVKIQTNGSARALVLDARLNLFAALRRQGYFRNVRGCSSGDCGVCEVIVGKKTLNACQFRAEDVAGKLLVIES
ncbi:MAG: 2Fe-2S iron-sulfur cluster-binding protein [bacterium]